MGQRRAHGAMQRVAIERRHRARRLPGTQQFADPAMVPAHHGPSVFTPIGENGRACVSCHQPANGMSVSVDAIRARWAETGGKDPIFAAIDGANCPSLPQADPKSHSLLLERGLFRIFVPWPAKGEDGRPLKPEFDIEVVRDPTGCNTDPVYGLKSASPQISVFRRPRVVANMKYVVQGGAPLADGQVSYSSGAQRAQRPQPSWCISTIVAMPAAAFASISARTLSTYASS